MVGEAVLIVPGVWYGANIKTLTEATLTENIRGREQTGRVSILGDCKGSIADAVIIKTIDAENYHWGLSMHWRKTIKDEMTNHRFESNCRNKVFIKVAYKEALISHSQNEENAKDYYVGFDDQNCRALEKLNSPC